MVEEFHVVHCLASSHMCDNAKKIRVSTRFIESTFLRKRQKEEERIEKKITVWDKLTKIPGAHRRLTTSCGLGQEDDRIGGEHDGMVSVVPVLVVLLVLVLWMIFAGYSHLKPAFEIVVAFGVSLVAASLSGLGIAFPWDRFARLLRREVTFVSVAVCRGVFR